MFPEENKIGVKMATTVSKSFEVKALDSSTADEIKKAVTETQPQEDGSKVIGLNFISTEGSIPMGISLLESMHKSDVDFLTNGGGEIQLSAVLPLAGGKFGERTAEATALFLLYDVSAGTGKTRKALNAEEANALEILDKLSGGRKTRIKALMLTSAKVTAAQMKSLGLIDKIKGEFVDKYAQARLEAKNKK